MPPPPPRSYFCKAAHTALLLPLLVLIFLSAASAPLFASGKKEVVAPEVMSPKVERPIILSSNQIHIDIDWSGVKNRSEYRYALYRGKILTKDQNSGSRSPNTYSFVKNLEAPYPEITTPEEDDTVEPGYTYFYQIFFIKKTDPARTDEFFPKRIDITRLEKWIGPEKTSIDPSSIELHNAAAPGIYVGIISFSSEAIDITKTTNDEGVETGALVPIDSYSRTEVLLQQFTTNYKLSANNGTALYYAFHKAMVNILDNIRKDKLPADLKSIHIITLTDGSDNASANPALADIIQLNEDYKFPREDRLKNGYPKFLQSKLWPYENSNIEGIPLRAWAVNLSPDVGNQELMSIANTQDEHQIVKIEDVKKFFGAFAAGLDNVERQTILTVTLPSFYDSAEVAIRIRGEGDPELVRGTIKFLNGIPHFQINLANSTPNINDKNIDVEAKKTGDNDYAYQFTLNKKLPPDTDVSVLLNVDGKWREDKNEFIKDFNYNPFVERKSALVYFVLDSSRSLSNDIDIIRDAVKETIEELYRKNIGEGQKNENETANKSVYNVIPSEELPLPKAIFNQADFIRLLEENNNAATWYRIEISNTKADENIQIWKIISDAALGADLQATSSLSKIGEVSVVPSAAYGQRDVARLIAEEGEQLWIPRLIYNIPPNLEGSGWGFWVQIGAYKNLENAVKTLQILYDNNLSNVSIFKEVDPGTYKVRLGPFNTRTEAASALKSIRGEERVKF
jgi:hypothetical protein